jgi:hypothetical protein
MNTLPLDCLPVQEPIRCTSGFDCLGRCSGAISATGLGVALESSFQTQALPYGAEREKTVGEGSSAPVGAVTVRQARFARGVAEFEVMV